jgi:hypothetical protein
MKIHREKGVKAAQARVCLLHNLKYTDAARSINCQGLDVARSCLVLPQAQSRLHYNLLQQL